MTDDPTRTADYGYFPWERDNHSEEIAQRRSEEAMQREVDDMENGK